MMRRLFTLACAAVTLAACDSNSTPLGVAEFTTGSGSFDGGLSMQPNSIELRVGGRAQLVTTGPSALLPVSYSTDAAAVATVSSSGVVTGVAPGVAIITATSTQEPSRRTSAVVRVFSP